MCHNPLQTTYISQTRAIRHPEDVNIPRHPCVFQCNLPNRQKKFLMVRRLVVLCWQLDLLILKYFFAIFQTSHYAIENMSWLIDTKAISSLLKEAQKQIDKALDIKDDEGGTTSSESLEVLSTPPGSELVSPVSSASSHTVYESDSVEVISTFDTSRGISQIGSSAVTSPESIEVLTDVDSPDTEVPVTVKPITTAPRLRLALPATEEETTKMNESHESDRTVVSDGEMYEIRTVSDSTTSFEEILPSIRPTYQPDETLPPRKSSSGESDDIETATSSDIEIISSPSTATSACRESPQKPPDGVEKKGHFREPSEVSIQSTASEDSHFSTHSETEKLLKRINELTEILEQRETKLLELGRRNSELNEKNLDLQQKIDARIPLDHEEYAQRMSALKKKFQQTIREKEAFRKELAAMKQEFIGKISKTDAEKSLAEKEEMISELRNEGELNFEFRKLFQNFPFFL